MRILKLFLLLPLIMVVNDTMAGRQPKCFRHKRTLVVFRFMGKMTDSYVKLRRGNNFEIYKRIFGITKYDVHTGTYVQKGDTLLFHFCNGIPEDASNFAVLSNNGSELSIDDGRASSYKTNYTISKDKRRDKTKFQ